MKKKLNKPSNWQDFEDLCKELWRDEWKCPEISSHGRNGQSQQGVDIFGVPDGYTEYYGIQCKHKSLDDRLSESEIDHEINQAKKFPVPLKMLYIATTSESDAKTQKYVMQKDIEHRKSNLFGIRLFSWQEICDILRRHKRVLDWYLSEMFFNHEMELYINDFNVSNQEVILKPKFIRKIKEVLHREPVYVPKEIQEVIKSTKVITNVLSQIDNLPNFGSIANSAFTSKFIRNKSLVKLNIYINNSGDEPLENFYLFIKISEKDYMEGVHFQNGDNLVEDNEPDWKLQEYRYDEDNEIINSGMMRKASTLINLPKVEKKITLSFDFYSKNYKDNGVITIKNEPLINDIKVVEYTHDKAETGVWETVEDITEEYEMNVLDVIYNTIR